MKLNTKMNSQTLNIVYVLISTRTKTRHSVRMFCLSRRVKWTTTQLTKQTTCGWNRKWEKNCWLRLHRVAPLSPPAATTQSSVFTGQHPGPTSPHLVSITWPTCNGCSRLAEAIDLHQRWQAELIHQRDRWSDGGQKRSDAFNSRRSPWSWNVWNPWFLDLRVVGDAAGTSDQQVPHQGCPNLFELGSTL